MYPQALPSRHYTDAIRVIQNRIGWLESAKAGRADMPDGWETWASHAALGRTYNKMYGLHHVLAMAGYGLPLSYESDNPAQNVLDLLHSALRYAKCLEKRGDDMDMLYARWSIGGDDWGIKGTLREAQAVGAFDPRVPAPANLRRCVSEWAPPPVIEEYQAAATAAEWRFQNDHD